MLIKAASDTRDEGRGNEYCGKNEGNPHDRAGNFFHGFEGRRFGSKTLLDVPFDGLNDDNGVIND